MKLGDGNDGIFDGDQPTFAQAGPAAPGGAKLTPEEEEIVAQEKKFIDGISRGAGGVLGGSSGGGDSGAAVEAINDLASLVKDLIRETRMTRAAIENLQLEVRQGRGELEGETVEPGGAPPQLGQGSNQPSEGAEES